MKENIVQKLTSKDDMGICLGHSGIDFDRTLYPDTGEDKEYVLNAKYRLD